MNQKIARADRAVIIGFCTAAYSSSAAFLTAWLYARSYDPWLTPRITHYMIVWWDIGGPIYNLMILLVLFGIAVLLKMPQLRRRLVVWVPMALMLWQWFVIGPR